MLWTRLDSECDKGRLLYTLPTYRPIARARIIKVERTHIRRREYAPDQRPGRRGGVADVGATVTKRCFRRAAAVLPADAEAVSPRAHRHQTGKSLAGPSANGDLRRPWIAHAAPRARPIQ